MKARITRDLVADLKPKAAPYEVRDTSLTGLLLRVQPSDVRTWYFDYKVHGVRNRVVLGRWPGVSPDGARALCKIEIGRVAAGIDLQAEKKAARGKAKKKRLSTLKAFLDGKYGEWVEAHRKSGKFTLSRIRADFRDWLDKPMGEINSWLVEGWRSRQRKQGKQPVTINRDLQRLQSCLSKAVEWELLDLHPLTGLKKLPQEKDDRVRYLSTEEEARLRKGLVDRENQLRAARDRFNAWREERGLALLPQRTAKFVDHLRPMTLVALNTGLRRGELLGLQWGAVDLVAKTVKVTAATAKSNRTRYVPLNDEAHATLSSWKEQISNCTTKDFVYAHADGKPLTTIATAWSSLITRAKLKDFHFHDCRHHFASKLVQAGTDLNVVRELLGHSEIAMTLRYAHLKAENLQQAVARIQSG